MSISHAPCPENSIVYNDTLCECSPGYYFDSKARSCILFTVSPADWVVQTGVDYSISFLKTLFAFDQIKKFKQSQAVFLEATFVLLLTWLLFCGLLRLGRLGDGRTLWFRVRWWISRFDTCFATRHWLDDQNVVTKRKTELGGTFSMASCILFIGLFAALLYQIISKRKVEIHNVRATNAPELTSFVNDLEFNITTISSMSCSQLRGLDTLLMANPGFIGSRAAHLSRFANYSCLNTSIGPMISLKCNDCRLSWDNVYISWQFVDIPNNPATAVGFQFNLSATNLAHRHHVSLVTGRLKNGSEFIDQPITFRGANTNIFQFNLFPRIYHNFHGLKLVQPLFHEFVPGSFISDAAELQSSLQSPIHGLINTTLFINFLSDYVVEIDNQNILGPVSFLADLGGLYCISIGIFYFLLVQCEYRIKRLRKEDQAFRDIKRRRKVEDQWDKVRKYVFLTWGCKALQQGYFAPEDEASCGGFVTKSFRKPGSLHRRSRQWEEISLHTVSSQNPELIKEVPSAVRVATLMSHDNIRPPPTDFEADSGNDVSDIQRSLRSLYEYNTALRDELIAAQSKIDALQSK